MQNKEKEEAKANKEGKPEGSILETDTPSAAANASPKPNPSQSLQVATAQRAQRFQKKYFSGNSSSSGVQTDGMRQLSSICSDLTAPGKVQELLGLLRDQDSANISTFEFLTSGAVHQLRDFLAGADLMRGKAKAHVDSQKLLGLLLCSLWYALTLHMAIWQTVCADASALRKVHCSCTVCLVASFADIQLMWSRHGPSSNDFSLASKRCSW